MAVTKSPSLFPDLDRRFETMKRNLGQLSDDLERLKDRIRDGDETAAKDAQRLVADIRTWVRSTMEAEAEIEKREKRKHGIENHYALDLAEARKEIGRRLDRLSAALDQA